MRLYSGGEITSDHQAVGDHHQAGDDERRDCTLPDDIGYVQRRAAVRGGRPCDAEEMSETLTSREAFEAMRLFLAKFNEREPEHRRETIFFLLGWTQIQDDGGTSDPAQWEDWKRAVADAKAGKSVSA